MTIPNAGKDVKEIDPVHSWWECKIIQPLGKVVWQFVKKLNLCEPYNSAVTLLGIYLREMKTYIQAKTYMQMFIAALLVIGKKWK